MTGPRPADPVDAGWDPPGGGGVYDDEDDFAEYEPMPPARPGARRLVVVLVTLAIAGLVAAAATFAWASQQIDPGSPGEAVEVEIPAGSSTQRIGAILDERGVITNATVFRYWARYKDVGTFQAGTYTFRLHDSFESVIATLEKGPALPEVTRITIPEGFNLKQIATRVGKLPGRSADRFLEVAASGEVRSAFQPPGVTSMEGLLFPETYDIDPDTDDERAIAERMIKGLEAVAAELDLVGGAGRLGRTPYEIITIASMIEAESKIESERGMVAQVIYNRLKRGETLGIDATLRYGLNRPTQPLRQSDLATDSPYNTRKRKGLPPTPISMPGRSALQAALNPTPGPWIFYVLADADGRHAFSTTAAEFARDKAQCKAKGLCG